MRDLVHSALAKQPHDRPTARELLDRLLASAPSPSPTARQHEAPFLREVMRSGEHAAPDRPSNTRPPVGRSSVARPTSGRPYSTRSGGAWSSAAGSATARSGSAPAGPAAVSAPPAQSAEPASNPIVLRPRPAGRALRRSTLLGRACPAGPCRPAGRPVAQVRRAGGPAPVADPAERRRHRAGMLLAGEPGLPRARQRRWRPRRGRRADRSPTRRSPVGGPPTRTASRPILNGEPARHAACPGDRQGFLSLTVDGAAIVSGDAGRRTEFMLRAQRHGLSDPHSREGRGRPALPGRQAGRRPHRGAGRRLDARQNDSTLFDLTATGEDGQSQPATYLPEQPALRHRAVELGPVQALRRADRPALVDTTFVLVDQGPANSGCPASGTSATRAARRVRVHQVGRAHGHPVADIVESGPDPRTPARRPATPRRSGTRTAAPPRRPPPPGPVAGRSSSR